MPLDVARIENTSDKLKSFQRFEVSGDGSVSGGSFFCAGRGIRAREQSC